MVAGGSWESGLGSVPGAGNELGRAGDGDSPRRPILDRSTVGQPGKYAGYHVPEFEEAFPSLVPLHVMHGLAPEQNVITLFRNTP